MAPKKSMDWRSGNHLTPLLISSQTDVQTLGNVKDFYDNSGLRIYTSVSMTSSVIKFKLKLFLQKIFPNNVLTLKDIQNWRLDYMTYSEDISQHIYQSILYFNKKTNEKQ